jgi:hypothetical protein
MTIIVTNCSKRKRFPPDPRLLAGNLATGSVDEVTREWVCRVGLADAQIEAGSLYSGRQFRESVLASRSLGATLLIVSAGLGVLRPTDVVPSYGLTVAPGASDGILDRLTNGASAEDWWQAITRHFRSLDATVVDDPARLILIALPSPYLSMIEHEIEQFAPERLSRTRIFTGQSFRFRDARLNHLLMPYDTRLDGPNSPARGTKTDFASRALRDFATAVLPFAPDATPETHAAAVLSRIERWGFAVLPQRERHSDADLLEIIRTYWNEAGGSASQMLRWVRGELGLACEQGRMKGLYAVVQNESESAA